MRSVPHRVVCLLGLDDGLPPPRAARRRRPDARPTRTWASATRAARTASSCSTPCWPPRDRLIVTYTGNDERTNAPRPAAVPVGELLDAVDRTVQAPRGAARERSSSATRCSRSTRATSPPARSRARPAVELRRRRPRGRRGLAGERRAPGPFLAAPLPPRGRPVIELDDLVRFVEHPVRAFLRQRLGVSRRRLRRRDRRRASRSSSTASSSGAWATGCSTRAWPASTRDAPSPAERPAAPAARRARASR